MKGTCPSCGEPFLPNSGDWFVHKLMQNTCKDRDYTEPVCSDCWRSEMEVRVTTTGRYFSPPEGKKE